MCMPESLFQPSWNEKVDERGALTDPLSGDRSRNRLGSLFSHGLITSTTLRLRYVSVFCWAIDRMSKEEYEEGEEYRVIKNVEKLFCLSSRYQKLQQNQGGVLTGMDGNTRFNYNMEEFDEVVLDDLELLKNDGYAYSQFYEILLQSFLLKRGELELTTAGEEIAAIVREHLGSVEDEILRCAEEGKATREDFESFAYPFANQTLYLEEEFEDERNALQKVFLGFLGWEGDKGSGSVELSDSFPELISLNVLSHLKETLEEGDVEEIGASKLYQKYHRGYHRYRRAHSLFLLRSWQLRNEMDEGQSTVQLTSSDLRAFEEYREMMRVYWLQVYTTYAFEAQLEALSTFLNTHLPARYDYEDLVNKAVEPEVLSETIEGFKDLKVERKNGEASQKNLARDLMLYGSADTHSLDVSVPHLEGESGMLTVGDVRRMIDETFPEPYDFDSSSPTASTENCHPNMVLSAKAIRRNVNRISAPDNIDDETHQFESWGRSLAGCVWLVFLISHRFGAIESHRKWFYNYSYNRLNSTFASLPSIHRFAEGFDDDTPVEEVAQRLLEDRVVETHLRVFYDRLKPGNVKRILSFDQDGRICLEVSTEHGKTPYTANPRFIRFSEMNTLLRDAGLLENGDEIKYLPTESAERALSMLQGGEKS